jgi:hypothetical protein
MVPLSIRHYWALLELPVALIVYQALERDMLGSSPEDSEVNRMMKRFDWTQATMVEFLPYLIKNLMELGKIEMKSQIYRKVT